MVVCVGLTPPCTMRQESLRDQGRGGAPAAASKIPGGSRMTHPQLWRRIACGATLAVLAAACSETTAPKLIDPAGTAAAVSAADSALTSPVFTSFSTIGAKLTPVAAIFGPASLYSATKPDLGPRQPFALTLERATQLQALVPQLSNLTA